MKKVALSLIALLAAGTFAFAEDVAVEKAAAVTADLSVAAKAKFGVDLDTMKMGFANSNDFNLSLTIVPEGDSNKAGTGDVYGTITVENVKIYTDLEDGGNDDSNLDNAIDASNNGDALLSFGDVTAKIVFPNGYVQIYKNVDPSMGYGVDGDDDNGGATIVDDDAFYTYSNEVTAAVPAGSATTVLYTADGTETAAVGVTYMDLDYNTVAAGALVAGTVYLKTTAGSAAVAKKVGKYGGADTEWTLGTLPGGSAFDGTGIEIGYSLPSLADITIDVASNDGWNKSGNAWEGSIEVAQKAIEKLTFAAKFYSGSSSIQNVDLGKKVADQPAANKIGKSYLDTAVGVNFAYDLGVATPFADVNYFLNSTLSFDEVADGVDYNEDGDTNDEFTANVSGGYMEADLGTKLALADGFKAVIAATYSNLLTAPLFADVADLNNADAPTALVGAVATLDLASNKLAGPVGALFGVRLGNLLSTVKQDASKTTEIFAKVSFDAGNGVGVWVKGSQNSSAAKKSDSLFVKAGVDAVNIFPLVTLGAEYDSNDLGGLAKEAAKVADVDNQVAGQLFVYAKVAY